MIRVLQQYSAVHFPIAAFSIDAPFTLHKIFGDDSTYMLGYNEAMLPYCCIDASNVVLAYSVTPV